MIKVDQVDQADLVIHQPEGKRTLGLLHGKWEVPEEGLISADVEIEAMFYGDTPQALP